MSQNASNAHRILQLSLEPNDPMRLANLCGQQDEHLKLVEGRLDVTIRNRGNAFQIAGPQARTRAAANVIEHLYRETATEELSPDTVHLYLQESGIEALEEEDASDESAGGVVIRTPRVMIKPRGLNQQGYVQAIRMRKLISPN